MNTMSDFYDKLDLKYPEIAIAMEDIDRFNPGKVKFIIPVLTPNMDTTKLVSKTERQSKSNLRNNSNIKLEIENIKINNYIEIPVPSEICGGMNLDFLQSASFISSVGGGKDTYAYGDSTNLASFITDDIRYIKSGSKWIVVFVGGDITKPRIISRYLDD